MRQAIVSDIHGNLEALTAVLQDIADQGIDDIVCLGDVVGYGPNPRECLDTTDRFRVTLLGNHDQASLFDPEGFSSGAEKAIHWTRDQIQTPADPRDPASVEAARRRMCRLGTLPRVVVEEDRMFVHASPRSPLHEYIFPEDVHCRQKMDRIFQLVPRICFHGHTHVPGVFSQGGRFTLERRIHGRYVLDADSKWLVNVGSVGQPRDEDPRACYAIFDGLAVEYRRVPYPLDETVVKIHAIPEIDNVQGDRLRLGR